MKNLKSRFKKWIKLRKDTETLDGKLCYCGHTHRCECADPTIDMFEKHIKAGNIIEDDPENGWRSI